MAVAQVYQREIVEVPFALPDGQILPHPALVISCDELNFLTPDINTDGDTQYAII